ncbi:PREDICTED: T-cell activation Rho GTPase-activating protein-like [Haliaeetus leucocephalus]|uniref:T-cell activation Rho GTPase-activating protein-like n=1 Tax=Haliaeetus leucocephalus TaxID=52644 RepID=UPI00053CE52C|nr:PREDICTED: T-cell activation Rho GTPase-activating protein-like [Haliaeetus leucocephalus]
MLRRGGGSPPSGCCTGDTGVPRSSGDGGLGSSPPARSPLWGSALATAVGRQLLSQATVLLPLLQELLVVLHQEGPSTEGIFRKAASGTELRELREALDRDANVDLGSQPALLLAAVLKVSAADLRLEELLAGLETSKAHPEPLALQDFLRSIPDKLLVTHLYEDWMQAMERTSKQEKVEELKAVAEKLPAANLLLLKRLLSLLQHIGHNAATSRMSCSNLAICLGPNLLSPPNEDLLPLQAMLEVTEKVRCVGKPAAALPAHQSLAAQRSLAASSLEQMPVNTLVLFMIENCGDIVGEEVAGRSCPSAGESPAPTDGARALRLEEQQVPAVAADAEHQAEALPHAPPSLLGVLKEAGGDMVGESEMGEAPSALPPTTPESTAGSLGRPEEVASLSEDGRLSSGQGKEKKPKEETGLGRRKLCRKKEEEERKRIGGSQTEKMQEGPAGREAQVTKLREKINCKPTNSQNLVGKPTLHLLEAARSLLCAPAGEELKPSPSDEGEAGQKRLSPHGSIHDPP